MIGAIIGDIVGSRFEFDNHRSKQFELFGRGCFATDDSIMSLAVAKALMLAVTVRDQLSEADYYAAISRLAVEQMQAIGRHYPDCGYGGRFYGWIYSPDPKPYNSFGNGAAMRISPVGWLAESRAEVINLSRAVTEVSHNHPEGIKGAEATALAIFLARRGDSMGEIKRAMQEYYDLDFTIDGIRPTYRFNETCQATVPQALVAFFESDSFEDAIRTAISVGGDSDTLAAITGAVAEAYYGVPPELADQALSYLDDRLLPIYTDWQAFLARRS